MKDTAVQVSPPWGDYFGVVSQSVATATAATEVEVTVVTDQQMLNKIRQGNSDWDSLQQLGTYIPRRKQLLNGENKLQLCGSLLTGYCVHVPVRVQGILCALVLHDTQSHNTLSNVCAGAALTRKCASLSRYQWVCRSSISQQMQRR